MRAAAVGPELAARTPALPPWPRPRGTQGATAPAVQPHGTAGRGSVCDAIESQNPDSARRARTRTVFESAATHRPRDGRCRRASGARALPALSASTARCAFSNAKRSMRLPPGSSSDSLASQDVSGSPSAPRTCDTRERSSRSNSSCRTPSPITDGRGLSILGIGGGKRCQRIAGQPRRRPRAPGIDVGGGTAAHAVSGLVAVRFGESTQARVDPFGPLRYAGLRFRAADLRQGS